TGRQSTEPAGLEPSRPSRRQSAQSAEPPRLERKSGSRLSRIPQPLEPRPVAPGLGSPPSQRLVASCPTLPGLERRTHRLLFRPRLRLLQRPAQLLEPAVLRRPVPAGHL